MSENREIADLRKEINKTVSVLSNIDAFYKDFLEKTLPLLGKNQTSAIVQAEIFTDFYTCLESLFLKISAFFENELKKNGWHKDLLHKMTLEIRETRIPVISDKTYSILLEFLKFRHFKRYYHEFDYDWDKLEYLQKKYIQVNELFKNDVERFSNFLAEL
ncbi:hypothetical protein JXI42_04740 [bacterium]|nr:hypothetical protein [bacterium]